MAVEIKIRKAKKEDIGEMAVLIYRLKKLNEEFDTHFKVSSDAEKRIPEYLERILNEPDRFFIIVAAIGSKVVAVLKADVRERISYEPPQDIRITDFYIAPEQRRSGLGKRMISELKSEMRSSGYKLLTVEFPTFNVIAKNFYVKEKFVENITVLRYIE